MARQPAPEFPVRTYPNPVISEQVVIEFVTSELANSKPIEPGTPHPNSREFAGFKLGIQRVAPNDPYFTQRVWVNDQAANSAAYNYALKYVSESNAHPIFIRSDREPKTSYSPRTKGTALQTVYKLTVTNAGSGYVYGTQPALTFSSGAAAGHGVVSPTGTIAEFVITNGGLGYGTAPTFTVAAPTSGTTATGTAFIQPTTAILVAEEAQLYPQESEYYALYFNVLRIYQTLPGPVLTSKRVGDGAQGLITTNTKQELEIGAADYSPDFKTLSYVDTAIDSVKKERSLELVTDSAFPILSDYDIDPETFATILTTYQIVDASTAGTATCASGVITTYKHIDKWRSMKIVVTHSTPASYDEQKFGAHNFPTLFSGTAFFTDTCGHFVGLRGGFAAMVQMRITVSFTTSKQTISGLTLIPGTLVMGKGLQITDALFNSGSFTYFGNCTGTISWSATSPSYTAYLALIGTEQLITGESVKWKAGLYRNTSVYVKML